MFNYNSYTGKLEAFAKKSKRFISKLVKSNGTFAARIQKRHQEFWKVPDAEKIRNTIMEAHDPIEKWKDIKNWQRKLSNKYNAREFAKKHNCTVAELYWKGRDYNTINFNDLPENYVIRPTTGHSCGLVFLMKNSQNLLDGKTYSHEEIRKILAAALLENENLAFLIQEFVKTEDGLHNIPDDFKFYMYEGEVCCIQVINRLNRSEGFTSWYDENWHFISNLTINYPEGKEQNAPKYLTEMIAAAKRLSTAYEIFCRIDFYATDKGAVFGEFTPTPALGKGFTPAGDKLLASYWDKFCKGKI